MLIIDLTFYRCNNNNVNYNFEHEMYSILNLPQKSFFLNIP